jgi:hypothetical protein
MLWFESILPPGATAVDITERLWQFIEVLELDDGLSLARECQAFYDICTIVGHGQQFLVRLPLPVPTTTPHSSTVLDGTAYPCPYTSASSELPELPMYIISNEPEDLFTLYAKLLEKAGCSIQAGRVARAEQRIRAFIGIEDMMEGDDGNEDGGLLAAFSNLASSSTS